LANDPRRIGQILLERGLISAPQLEEVLNEQRNTGRFVGELLVARGVLSEEQIARALSEQLGFAFVDLKTIQPEEKALGLIPRELCDKHVMIPVFSSQNALTVAMANPLDVNATGKAQEAAGMRVRPVFACASDIRRLLGGKKEDKPAPSGKPEGGGSTYDPVTAQQQQANLRPVIERVTQIIEKAVTMGASDIHLEPEKKKFNCRYRIDGILHEQESIPVEEQPAVISRIKIIADMDIAEKRLPQDGRIRTHVQNRDIDLRVSTFPSIYGENIVIRILDRSQGLLHLEDLGFSAPNLEAFRKLIHRPYGMLLVTGPTGSGKTTALYGALTEINSAEKNVITLEDPVEYEVPNVRQSQINVKAGLTFASGLRSIVRQDPDVIMIGEIRDRETAEISIHAALTGHLVLSTLHTNDAPSAAARLIDMGVEPFLVSSSVLGILAQRLIRTLCPACKQSYTPSKELLEQLGLAKQFPGGDVTFYKENGCPKCKNYGYLGRTGIYELMLPNDRIKDLITKKASAVVISEEAVKSGMKTLRDAGIEKVIHGVTSVSEVLRVTEEI
jgi:type IV pilus assembly protein PilB